MHFKPWNSQMVERQTLCKCHYSNKSSAAADRNSPLGRESRREGRLIWSSFPKGQLLMLLETQHRVPCSTRRPEPAGMQIAEPTHNPPSELSKDCLKSRIIQRPKQQVVLWSSRITHLIFLRNEIEQPQKALQRKITKFIS